MNITKDLCFTTFARNEHIRLPIWLNYYKQFASDDDIYVIDQNTTDGSTTNLNCNVIYEPNEKVFDHKWLRGMLTKNLNILLQKYKIVVLTECDELIITHDNSNLRDYLIKRYKISNLNGCMDLYDVVQFENEKDYILGDKIPTIRNYLKPWKNARKHTIHTKRTNGLDNGFHKGSGIFDTNLTSIHFQCLNTAYFIDKITSRIQEKNTYGQGSCDIGNGLTINCWDLHYKPDLIQTHLNGYKKDLVIAPPWFKNNTYL